MIQLSSNRGEAQASASAISVSLGAIRNSPSVSRDYDSTLKGREKTIEWLDKVQLVSHQVSEVVQQMGTNINSVANEFEMMDWKLASVIASTLTSSMERLIDFND